MDKENAFLRAWLEKDQRLQDEVNQIQLHLYSDPDLPYKSEYLTFL